MYTYADSVVRTLVPAVLDVAGLKSIALQLRNLGPLSNPQDAAIACIILANIRKESVSIEPEWYELINEISFWAHGAVQAALKNDRKLFKYCMSQVRNQMDSGMTIISLMN